MSDELTLANFHEKTGFRFRVSNEQNERIENGTLTREQAFEEFVASGGPAKLKPRKPEIPDSVYLSDGLTVDNFSERVKEATGVSRRFRMSREQFQRQKDGLLTREQALQEVIASVKAAQATSNN
jgi:hypothetical protein